MKTAVSEAVTNVIIHGYEKEVRKVYIKCMIEENIFTVEVCDQGKGIENIGKIPQPEAIGKQACWGKSWKIGKIPQPEAAEKQACWGKS